MKFELYDYQEELYKKALDFILNKTGNLAVQLATRGGKAPIMSKIMEHLIKSKKRIAFLAHTRILISQMSEELTDHEIKHGIIAAGYPQIKYRVQVISKDTLVRRAENLKKQGWTDFDCIFVDECHRIMGDTYLKILSKYPNARVFGFSATIIRTDNKPFDGIFNKLICGPQIKHLQKIKRYSYFDIFIPNIIDTKGIKKIGGDFSKKEASEAVDKPAIYGDLPAHYKKYAHGKKALTFCSSIDHSKHVCEEFNKAGINSVEISSKDVEYVRKEKLKKYYNGEYLNLVSVNLFIEGFHVKECECIIMARITTSLIVFLQTAGRGAMTYPGKSDIVYLDCVGNCLNENLGLPDDDRWWSLSGKEQKAVPERKRCPECRRPVMKKEKQCPFCGFLWSERADTGTRALPEQKEGELIRIKDRPEIKQNVVLSIARNAHNLKEAIKIARNLGIDHRSAYSIWTNDLKNDPKEIVKYV